MAKINIISGSIPKQVNNAVLDGTGNDAQTLHDDIVNNLHNIGADAKKEFHVKDRGDGKSGRVDIIAEFNGKVIGIEIDRKSPRKKSIYKLSNNFINYIIATR